MAPVGPKVEDKKPEPVIEKKEPKTHTLVLINGDSASKAVFTLNDEGDKVTNTQIQKDHPESAPVKVEEKKPEEKKPEEKKPEPKKAEEKKPEKPQLDEPPAPKKAEPSGNPAPEIPPAAKPGG